MEDVDGCNTYYTKKHTIIKRCLCGSVTGYCLKFQVYTNRGMDAQLLQFGYHVMMGLMTFYTMLCIYTICSPPFYLLKIFYRQPLLWYCEKESDLNPLWVTNWPMVGWGQSSLHQGHCRKQKRGILSLISKASPSCIEWRISLVLWKACHYTGYYTDRSQALSRHFWWE